MTKEALKLALDALKDNQHLVADNERHAYVMEYNGIIEKCEEALAQPEQEPVAFEEWLANQHGDPEEIGFLQALRIAYISGQDSTTPPQRKPLDMTEIVRLTYDIDEDKPATMAELFRFARAIETAHGIKE